MLKEIINNIESRTDSIKFIKVKNNNVDEYFKMQLGCEFVPKQIIEFYENYDGASFLISDIYSLKSLKDLKEQFINDANNFEIEYTKDKFIPIANDGMGGFYVFSSNKNDEKIYWIDSENVGQEWMYYQNLEEFLNEMYNAVL